MIRVGGMGRFALSSTVVGMLDAFGSQTTVWLQGLVEEGVLVKNEPASHVVKQNGLFD